MPIERSLTIGRTESELVGGLRDIRLWAFVLPPELEGRKELAVIVKESRNYYFPPIVLVPLCPRSFFRSSGFSFSLSFCLPLISHFNLIPSNPHSPPFSYPRLVNP